MRRLAPTIVLMLASAGLPAAAEEIDPDQFLTRESWKQRVQEQKDRLARMRREGIRPATPAPEQLEAQRIERAFDDPDLQRGDIVSTGAALFRFDGWTADGQRRFTPL